MEFWNCDGSNNDIDDTDQPEEEANTNIDMVKDASHSGVSSCYWLVSKHVSIPSLWQVKLW